MLSAVMIAYMSFLIFSFGSFLAFLVAAYFIGPFFCEDNSLNSYLAGILAWLLAVSNR